MRPAPHLLDEEERLVALAEYDLIGDAQVEVDEIVELAACLFDVPIVLISVIARERQFVKACTGLDVCELDRGVSLCAHALEEDEILVVADATLDIRFAANPFVIGDPIIRFYASSI